MQAAEREVVRQYLADPSPESAAVRATRHRLVATRRAGPAVMVHRGATAFAPENSLEAYAAALDYGADGCEVDVRRTRDGVLVLFHDPFLDRLTDGLGRVEQVTYRELQSLRLQKSVRHPAWAATPTFAALLDLARERAMLLHLDLKEPGLESAVTQLLDEADAWDHVVSVNAENAAGLLRHPALRTLAYKAPGLYQGRRDLDPAAIESALQQPGQMILVDDPRVAVSVLGRAAYHPRPYTKTYRIAALPPLGGAPVDGAEFNPLALIRALAAQTLTNEVDRLLDALAPRKALATDAPEASLVERAWAAQQLGLRGERNRRIVAALEQQARRPTPHPDWAYHGLDAALAIRALGHLKASGSGPLLIELLRGTPRRSSRPDGTGPSDPRGESFAEPGEWRNSRVTMYALPALGEMPCRAARRFLARYVRASEAEALRYGPAQFEEATRALLCQRLTWDEIADLLRSPNPAVRGTALMECLDHYTEERGLALRSAAPWALALPRARP